MKQAESNWATIGKISVACLLAFVFAKCKIASDANARKPIDYQQSAQVMRGE